MVTTPARIADARVVRLLHPGDRIDVPAAAQPPEGAVSPGRARAVAQSMPVLALPHTASGTAGDQGALIVPATSRDQAAMLAAAGSVVSLAIVS